MKHLVLVLCQREKPLEENLVCNNAIEAFERCLVLHD